MIADETVGRSACAMNGTGSGAQPPLVPRPQLVATQPLCRPVPATGGVVKRPFGAPPPPPRAVAPKPLHQTVAMRTAKLTRPSRATQPLSAANRRTFVAAAPPLKPRAAVACVVRQKRSLQVVVLRPLLSADLNGAVPGGLCAKGQKSDGY